MELAPGSPVGIRTFTAQVQREIRPVNQECQSQKNPSANDHRAGPSRKSPARSNQEINGYYAGENDHRLLCESAQAEKERRNTEKTRGKRIPDIKIQSGR